MQIEPSTAVKSRRSDAPGILNTGMATANHRLATIDRRPYFERALTHGVGSRIIDRIKCDAIVADAAKGTVQVAQYFGTSHLFAALDNARKRIVHLVSLYLEQQCGDDLDRAARSLQENSFLSHSRGGNELLKALHAMPESAVFDDGGQGQALKEFQDERTLAKPMNFAAYRKELARRDLNQRMLEAARWFAQDMRVSPSALDSVAAEAVIRTGLLRRLGRSDDCPNRPEFAALIVRLRDGLAGAVRLPFPKSLMAQVPSQHQAIAAAVRREIDRHDAPLLADLTRPLDAVLDMLDARYFLRDTGLEDVDAFDAFVSQEWKKLTKGREDPFSRQTVLLCLAAGVRPKTTLSVPEARALIRRVRTQGFDTVVVPEMINTSAPFSIRSDLLSMWDHEFFPDAQERLLDVADEKYIYAMQFMTENCNIRKK